MIKNLPVNAEGTGDMGGQETLEEGEDNPFAILAWKIPWTRSLSGYSPWSQSQTQLSMYAKINIIPPTQLRFHFFTAVFSDFLDKDMFFCYVHLKNILIVYHNRH